MLASAPKPDPSETPAERRARLDANAANTPLADGVVKESVEISGVPGAAWLRPESHDPDGLPALLFFHGGGYRVGSIISHQGFGSHLASLIPARVLMIDYRLAPEDPFPAAVDDCVAAYRWMLDTGIDPPASLTSATRPGADWWAPSCSGPAIRGCRFPEPVSAYRPGSI